MVKPLHKALWGALLMMSVAAPVLAQTSPGFVTGQVPTALQWNGYFSGKQDFNAALTALTNSAGRTITINSVPCVLAASCTVTAVASQITVGTTAISGGTSGNIEFNNAGVLGEKAVTGTGNVVLATNAVLVTPALGTPASGVLTNATGLPISTGLSGLGTGVATALGVNVGTAGAPVINGGALGTPLSGSLANATGLPIASGVSGLGTGVATLLSGTSSGTGGPAGTVSPTFTGTVTFPGAGTATSTGFANLVKLGIGMSPTNILDITQNQNAASIAQIQNTTSATASSAEWRTLSSGGLTGRFAALSGAFTTSGILQAGRVVMTSSSVMAIGTLTAQPIIIGLNNVEIARFDYDSTFPSLFVGATSAPSSSVTGVELANVGGTVGGVITITNAGSTVGRPLQFYTSSGQAGNITTSGTTTTYNTSSDQRLKNDLGLASSITSLERLKVHNFTWKANGQHDLGVFAQEAYKVKPTAVVVGGADPKKKPWGVDYSKFVPDLIVGWQNHEARLAELERKVANDDMRERLDPYAHAFCISKLCIGWK